MMGSRANYFRHSINAHNDTKLMKVVEKHGLGAAGAYFYLLEIYASFYMDDDERKLIQTINLRLIANTFRTRTDLARKLLGSLAEVKLIDHFSPTSDGLSVNLAIPNLLKYFGRFEKDGPINRPNKSKVKESKVKDTDAPFEISEKPKINKAETMRQAEEVFNLCIARGPYQWNTYGPMLNENQLLMIDAAGGVRAICDVKDSDAQNLKWKMANALEDKFQRKLDANRSAT